MQLATTQIDRRFAGPPNSGNGGYSCGLIAAHIDGAAEVTLFVPPPLETLLTLHRAEDGTVELRQGDVLIGSGKPASVETSLSAAPGFAEATDAAARTFAASKHPLPTCFVCGPDREEGDGLRIHPGPLDADDDDWSGLLAAPWVPGADLGDAEGRVRNEFLWAALDCPTAYASSSPAGMRIILLGRQAVTIHERPRAGSRLVVIAQQTGQEGRKYFAESALLTDDGSRLAECRAVWIAVSREVQAGTPA